MAMKPFTNSSRPRGASWNRCFCSVPSIYTAAPCGPRPCQACAWCSPYFLIALHKSLHQQPVHGTVQNFSSNADNTTCRFCPVLYLFSPFSSHTSRLNSPSLALALALSCPRSHDCPALLSTQNPRSGVLSARSSAALSRRPTSSTRTSSFTFMIIPANCGSAGWKTVWQRRWRPSAARTPRVRSGRPMAERWRVMRK